jgi:hypothetical protein
MNAREFVDSYANFLVPDTGRTGIWGGRPVRMEEIAPSALAALRAVLDVCDDEQENLGLVRPSRIRAVIEKALGE